MSRFHNIEGVDGGVVEFNQDEEDAMDAMNADTFGDDDMEEVVAPQVPARSAPPSLPSPSGNPLADLMRQSRLSGAAEVPSAPPGLTQKAPEILSGGAPKFVDLGANFSKFAQSNFSANSSIFSKQEIPAPFPPMRVSPPPPPPPPASPPPPPPPASPPRREVEGFFESPTQLPQQSIHVIPVRVFPSPFTELQRQQALHGDLNIHKWGRQPGAPSNSLMSARDKEFVTKIQLNQMAALSATQNYRGKFIFARSQPPEVVDPDISSSLGKRHYASVYHPRKLLETASRKTQSEEPGGGLLVELDEKISIENCFDLLLDLHDVDEYIATLHPLAEEKIAEAIAQRTEVLDKVTLLICAKIPTNKGKAGVCKKRAIDAIVELLQPTQTASEAEARRSLIFRRVPETVQALYVDMLEQLVGGE